MARDEDLVGVADVARQLGLSEGDVRAWARSDGAVPRIGTTWVFRERDVERLALDVEEECYEPNPDDGDPDDDDLDDDDLDNDEPDDDDDFDDE